MNFKFVNIALGIVVCLAAFAMALYFIYTDVLPGMAGWKRTVFVIVLFCYGFYRLYRAVVTFRNPNQYDS